MSVTLTTNARNGACNGIVDLVDVGSGVAQGTLKIYTAGMALLLADLDMSNPAFGAAAVGVATASAISDETSAIATGDAAEFQIVDRDGAEVFRGSVGTSGEDINLSSISITIGDTVSISSFTATMPAS